MEQKTGISPRSSAVPWNHQVSGAEEIHSGAAQREHGRVDLSTDNPLAAFAVFLAEEWETCPRRPPLLGDSQLSTVREDLEASGHTDQIGERAVDPLE